jgi:hypothetical protein
VVGFLSTPSDQCNTSKATLETGWNRARTWHADTATGLLCGAFIYPRFVLPSMLMLSIRVAHVKFAEP